MSRLVTLLGYAAVAGVALVLELLGRRSRRVSTFGEALDVLLRSSPARVVLLAGWLWLGWHLFARVDWQ